MTRSLPHHFQFIMLRIRFSLLTIGLIHCGVSPAAEPVDEVVITASRRAEQLQDYAGSISVIGERDIARTGSTHHAETLNRAAGAMIQRNSGEESLTAIRSPVLSGPGSCATFLFLEDSVPIRPVGFCNVNELFETNIEQAQSIEVLRGPAGVTYGSGSMHGAVNVLSPTPAQLPRLGLSVESGSEEFYRGKFAAGHVGTATDVGAVGLFTQEGGWREQSGLQEQKMNAMLRHRLENASVGLNLTATNLNQETAGFIQGENSYRDAAIARSNPNPEAYRDAYALRLTGQYQQIVSPSLQLDVRPYLRHSRMDFLQHFLVGKPREENGQDSIGLLTSLRIDRSARTGIVAGVDVEFAEGFLKEIQSGPATDGTPSANAIRPAGKHYDYTVDSAVAALYAQLNQALGERWKLALGVRLEHVTYDYDNKMIAGNSRDDGAQCAAVSGCLYARPEDRSDHFTTPSAKLGLAYRLHPDHTLYGNVTQGYRAPDTSELYRLQRQQRVADLDAEELLSVEVGARGQVSALRYSVAGFDMTKDNVIFRDANAFNTSDGRTKHRGVEYELSWSVLNTVSLELAGTYAKHTYDFSRAIEQGEIIAAGRDVDTAPRHVNTARVQWTPITTVSTELEWISMGKYFVDAANAHTYEGHDLLNLRASWAWRDHWDATLRVINLTDRSYADRADYAFGNYRYFPGRDRSVFVGMSYRVD